MEKGKNEGGKKKGEGWGNEGGASPWSCLSMGAVTPLPCLFPALLSDRSRWGLPVCVLSWRWTSRPGTTHS